MLDRAEEKDMAVLGGPRVVVTRVTDYRRLGEGRSRSPLKGVNGKCTSLCTALSACLTVDPPLTHSHHVNDVAVSGSLHRDGPPCGNRLSSSVGLQHVLGHDSSFSVASTSAPSHHLAYIERIDCLFITSFPLKVSL